MNTWIVTLIRLEFKLHKSSIACRWGVSTELLYWVGKAPARHPDNPSSITELIQWTLLFVPATTMLWNYGTYHHLSIKVKW